MITNNNATFEGEGGDELLLQLLPTNSSEDTSHLRTSSSSTSTSHPSLLTKRRSASFSFQSIYRSKKKSNVSLLPILLIVIITIAGVSTILSETYLNESAERKGSASNPKSTFKRNAKTGEATLHFNSSGHFKIVIFTDL
jgi:predicted aspartyl protease